MILQRLNKPVSNMNYSTSTYKLKKVSLCVFTLCLSSALIPLNVGAQVDIRGINTAPNLASSFGGASFSVLCALYIVMYSLVGCIKMCEMLQLTHIIYSYPLYFFSMSCPPPRGGNRKEGQIVRKDAIFIKSEGHPVDI